jgi:hypothetical protein
MGSAVARSVFARLHMRKVTLNTCGARTGPATMSDMILHLALFTWRDDVTPDDVAELTRQLTDMAGGIPALRRYHCGENLRLRPSDADYAVAAMVDDADGLAAYLDSDAHKAVYDRILGRMIASRQAAQLDIGHGG